MKRIARYKLEVLAQDPEALWPYEGREIVEYIYHLEKALKNAEEYASKHAEMYVAWQQEKINLNRKKKKK